MKLTNVLLKQHNGWWFKLQWKYANKRTIQDTGAVAALQSRGIVVRDALEYVEKAERI
jgi:hypothetical protein